MKWPVSLHNGDTRGMYSHRIISIQHHIGVDREKSWKKLKRGRRRQKKRGDEMRSGGSKGSSRSCCSPQFCLHRRLHELFDCSMRTFLQTGACGPCLYTTSHCSRTDCLLICVTDFMISMEDILNSIPKGRCS